MKNKNFIVFAVIYLIVMLMIVSQTMLIFSFEIKFLKIIDEYRSNFFYTTGEGYSLRSAWDAILHYKQSFIFSYGRPEVIVLSRKIEDLDTTVFFPILSLYYWSLGREKLVLVQKSGSCMEFAVAVATLLREAAGLSTRVVYFEGIDHAFPEVYFDGAWWVLDAAYTTRSYPLRAEEYASHLRNTLGGLDVYVSRIVVENSEADVTREHGFNTSTLVIRAILDPTSSAQDDIPLARAEVKIFALKNKYDPLVAKGHTNAEGIFSVHLNGGKEYIIIVKGLCRSVVGVTSLFLQPNAHMEVEVRLHKYD